MSYLFDVKVSGQQKHRQPLMQTAVSTDRCGISCTSFRRVPFAGNHQDPFLRTEWNRTRNSQPSLDGWADSNKRAFGRPRRPASFQSVPGNDLVHPRLMKSIFDPHRRCSLHCRCTYAGDAESEPVCRTHSGRETRSKDICMSLSDLPRCRHRSERDMYMSFGSCIIRSCLHFFSDFCNS